MANIGLKSAFYAKHGTSEFETATALVGMIDAKFSKENNSAELYADDVLMESDYSFKKGTLSLTIAYDKDEVISALFGHTMTGGTSSQPTVLTKAVSDTAPYVGYGHIIPKLVNGTKMYKVEVFPKVKFTDYTADAATKGDSISFNTASLTATVYALDEAYDGFTAGTYGKSGTYASEEAAITALKAFLGTTTSNSSQQQEG